MDGNIFIQELYADIDNTMAEIDEIMADLHYLNRESNILLALFVILWVLLIAYCIVSWINYKKGDTYENRIAMQQQEEEYEEEEEYDE